MPEGKHLYLVDGSSYIFRAYHRLPPLTNIRGEPVGAVYGYTTMLWKLVEQLNAEDGPTHLAVILDASSETFRNGIYDQYKANRPPPPEDLVPQFPVIRDATRAFSLPCIEEPGFEADDLIASYSRAALGQGWKVTIVSSDKDLMQLIEPGLDMLDTMKDARLGRDHVEEKFGVGPEKLGEALALMGDTADNIPGVTGIGPKTASKLINEFGTVDAVLSAAPDMKKSKMRENLIAQADNARMSRVLVTLKEDVPLPEPLDDFVLNGIPEEPLRAFFRDHGFKSLLTRIGGESANAEMAQHSETSTEDEDDEPAIDRSAYETIHDEAALDRWIAEARRTGHVAVDTETDSLESVTARLVGVCLATEPGKACYVPLGHGGNDLLGEKPDQIDFDTALAKLKPLFGDPAVLKIGHNLKYDMGVLAQHAITLAPVDDIIVMSFDLEAGMHGHGMDEIAQLFLDHESIKFKDVVGTGKKQISFAEVPLDKATEYAAEDADVTLRLWKRLKPRLPIDRVTRVYELVDRPLIPVIARMECAGIKVDREELARLSADFAEQMEATEKEVHAIAGQSFAIGSPRKLGEILFDKMGLKGGRKGKSGVWSTDVNEMERLARDGEAIAQKILDWRQLSKLKSTYTDALQAQINSRTGRVHTSYSLTGAQTGRLASTEPNLQNIPIRTETGRKIRFAFVAEPGNVLLAADYSQIELRLAAHMADVPALKQAFEAGEDIHNRTAQELFGEINRDTRGKAKTINFAILYGISRWGLAGRLEIAPDEAQEMIDRYFERFPGINQYITQTLTAARETGFTETLFGRKTHFPRLQSKMQHERQGSERAAINAPVQGTSADIIKRAMARMEPALIEAGLAEVRMLLQVHDELVFELPEKDIESASSVIRDVMKSAAEPLVKIDVPLVVDIGTGPNWGAAH